jgi:hypothetical protein
MAFPIGRAAEVVYETPTSTLRDTEPEPLLGFPQTIVREGRLFRLVAEEIVSRSGELTRLRVRYRQQ